MRKLAGICLAIMMVIGMAGCKSDTPPEATVSTLQEEELFLKAPENTGNQVVDYDPEREVYATCGEVFANLYCYPETGWSTTVDCVILSKKPLNSENVTVTASIPCEVEFLGKGDMKIVQGTEAGADNQSNGLLPYYVYQAYRGVDFTKEEDQEAIKTDFTRLRAEHLPKFYGYSMTVILRGAAVSEKTKLEYLDITIGDINERVVLDDVTIYPEKDNPVTDLDAIIHADGGKGKFQQFYNDGYVDFPVLLYHADKDVTITAGNVYWPGVEVLDWKVTYTQANGQTMEYSWDGKTPLDIYEGDYMQIEVHLHNSEMKGLNIPQWHIYTVFDCLFEGKKCFISHDMTQGLYFNAYELYAIVFDGVDMEPFYRDSYYKTHDTWINSYQKN